MSVCGQAEEDSSTDEPPGAPVRAMYEQKSVRKVVRVLTVLAYLLSVSLAAILLSVYYVCVWKSPELPPVNSTTEAGGAVLGARRAARTDHLNSTAPYNYIGGSNNTVSDDDRMSPPTPTNATSLPTNTSELADVTPTRAEPETSPEQPYTTTDVIGSSTSNNETDVT